MTGRFLEGVTSASAAKVLKSAGLPNIKGTLVGSGGCGFLYSASGAFYTYGNSHVSWDDGGDLWHHGGFDASRYNSIYGNSTTVQPNSYTVMYIMKIKA